MLGFAEEEGYGCGGVGAVGLVWVYTRRGDGDMHESLGGSSMLGVFLVFLCAGAIGVAWLRGFS